MTEQIQEAIDEFAKRAGRDYISPDSDIGMLIAMIVELREEMKNER